MSFSLFNVLKGLVIKQENTTTPAAVQILPGGTASTTTTIQAAQTANSTLTLPNVVTDTLVAKTTTDTLTNKTLTAPVIATIVNSGTLTLPTSTDTLVGRATSDTLTNKTLTAPVISTISNTGTLTLPTSTDTLVGRSTSDTLANKTLDNTTVETIKDVNFTIQDDADITRQLKFQASGISASTTRTLTAPDVSTTIVGTDATQTLSNKTFSDAVTLNGVATPSTPSSGNGKVYFKTDGFLYQLNSDGTETKVGAGSGGINYITNSDAESNTTGWAAYADAAGTSPVNGTGGSPIVTVTRSTSSPLRGVASFLLTKDAANRQGEGVSYDFTIASADQGKPLQIAFEWALASGTFVGSSTPGTNSDVTVWIYDVTNGVLIQPAGSLLEQPVSGQFYKYTGTFQTSSNSTSYRLIFHVTTTSASAYTLKLDTVAVGPQVISNGAAISDWAAYTPTSSWVSGVGTLKGNWRRVGDSMEIRGYVPLTGAPTNVVFTLVLPTGYTIDTAKLPLASADALGSAWAYDSSAATTYVGTVIYNNTTSVRVFNNAATSAWNLTTPVTWASGDEIDISFKVPIVGWSSNVSMSGDSDTRVVACRTTGWGTPSLNGTPVQLTPTNVVDDTHGGMSSGTYTVPVSGYYDISAAHYNTGTPSAAAQLTSTYIYKNGSSLHQGFIASEATAGSYFNPQVSVMAIKLAAGDTIKVYADSNHNTASVISSTTINFFSITKVSGPSQIAASETVGLRYTNATSFSVPSSTDTTISTGWTKEFDDHNIFSNGVITIPISGTYLIQSSLEFGSQSWTAGNEIDVKITRTGSFTTQINLGSITIQASTTQTHGVNGSAVIHCLAGDTISIQSYNGNASARTLSGDARFSHVSFAKIGN